MAIVEVKVPQLSESVAEATMLQWKKKPGEAVAIDEILIEIETDKVVLEVPAPAPACWPRSWSPTAAPWWPTSDRQDRHRRQGPPPRRRLPSRAAGRRPAPCAAACALPPPAVRSPTSPCPPPPS
jgi:2-oxoglutarate dehydrogenase E2 component (dihydrolipoamide succinyltransferase)